VIDVHVRYLRRKIESPGVPPLETRLTLPLARMFAR
jgi:DNA-binding response OmpR family regulator